MLACIASSVFLGLFICERPPDFDCSLRSAGSTLVLVLDGPGSHDAAMLNAVAAKLRKQYEEFGSIVLLVGRESVERWSARCMPRLSDAEIWLQASAFARSLGAQGLAILRVGEPPEVEPPEEDDQAVAQRERNSRFAAPGSKPRHPLGVSLLEMNLLASLYYGGLAERIDAEDLAVEKFLLCSGLGLSRTGGELKPAPQFEPFVDQTGAQKSMIGKMLGIAMRGSLVAFAGPYTVAFYGGLRTGDRIVAIDGRPVTDRTLWPALACCSPEAVRFTVQRGTDKIEAVVRPIEFRREWLAPFQCLGKRITELNSDKSVNDARGRWLTGMDAKRRIILLTCWEDQPGPWIATLHLVAERFKNDGLCWLAVSSDPNESAWTKVTSDNPTLAMQARDPSLAKDLAVEGLPSYFLLDADGTVLYCALEPNEVPAIVAGLLGADKKPLTEGGAQP